MKKGCKMSKKEIEKRQTTRMKNGGYNVTKKMKEKLRKANLGKILSKETRRKICESHKGKIKTVEHRKNLSIALTGNKPTKKTRKKQSNNMKNKWKDMEYKKHMILAHGGSLIRTPYPIEWGLTLQRAIRQRDRHTCQICGICEEELNRKLHVHHIDYNKQNCNIDNLISLCHTCHGKTNKFKDRQMWTIWLKIKVNQLK